jgi:uncharacterized membrane protein
MWSHRERSSDNPPRAEKFGETKGEMMATLTVWKFDDADAAHRVQQKLYALQEQQLVNVVDTAIVYWEPGKKRPKTKQGYSTTAAGATGGAFWGLLFGVLFFVPLFGLAIGAITGALAGALTDVGIDDGFINKVRAQVTEGTSALFLLTTDAVVDRLEPAAEGEHPHLIATNLPAADEKALRELFENES